MWENVTHGLFRVNPFERELKGVKLSAHPAYGGTGILQYFPKMVCP
jgi:hypothetical protein